MEKHPRKGTKIVRKTEPVSSKNRGSLEAEQFFQNFSKWIFADSQFFVYPEFKYTVCLRQCLGVVIAFSLTSCLGLIQPKPQGLVTLKDGDQETCAVWNSSYGVRSSKVCEMVNAYEFTIASRSLNFDKRRYQQKLRMLLGKWLVHNGYPQKLIPSAHVEIWVGSAVFTPEIPLLRVQVVAREGNMLFKLPFSPAMWTEAKISAFLLGALSYPKSSGYRAGELIITFEPMSRERNIRFVLGDEIAQNIKVGSFMAPTMTLSVLPLTETQVRSRLIRRNAELASTDKILVELDLSRAQEVAGEFIKAFEFSLLPH